MSGRIALSVLDLIPVRSDQTSSDALAASIALARRADELGFNRYWVAEHHNMPSVASTNPAVLIGVIAANTERLRVGSGGVMLPNHSPLVVAEQFGVLEAAFPGRIDLGIGRAPGSDPVITALLRSSGATSDVDEFARNIVDIGALMHPEGATLQLTSGRGYEVRATPAAASTADVWLLGSSGYSAALAAELGLPYVFANHFGSGAGAGTTAAIASYRSGFRPSARTPEPRTFVTVGVSVAPTADEAWARALPQLQHFARMRTGKPLTRLAMVEEAAAYEASPAEQQLLAQSGANWIIDEPRRAAERIRELAAQHEVDEVMVVPNASSPAGGDPRTSPGRVETIELLAAELLR